MNPSALWYGHEIQQLVKALTEQQHVDIDILLATTGLTAKQLRDPGLRISIEQEEQIYGQIAKYNSDPYLAIEQGKSLGVNHYGVLGQAMLGANTFREALLLMQKYSSIISWQLSMQLKYETYQGQDVLTIGLQTGAGDDRSVAFELENTIASIHTLLNQIVVAPVNFSAIELSTGQYADDLKPYQDLFNCPITFNAPATKMIIKRSLLRKRLPYAAPELSELRIQLCQKTLDSYSQQHGLVNALLTFISGYEQGIPTLKQSAEQFHRSERTMRRQLSELNTSYQQLIDQYRFDQAKQYLTNSTYTTETMAQLLGYSDSRSFRTAFKRWSGKTPSEYRALN
ncbi:AraC family transcriptional regulator ligand-binding domain-containing protein [Thalassotalea nanhaiensis]|uniref:AraC family transcriptional regulator ligand-binding domain-containing protein n=1 Tax=Thalassotalea nanhaiensis TaxID=3065648 RepID=A0ABY9TJB2_9GAMM|nr:AraC family transcriptional regulator ligand-binding domain-containing protein [Colwelliaceae bacterium SQ345]